MEIKLPRAQEREQYFDDLLARIREIRASEKTPMQKVADIVSCAIDYDNAAAPILFHKLSSKIAALGANGDLRFANCMIMNVERWAEYHHTLTLKDIEEQQRYWLMDADNNQHIYEFPCFSGIRVVDGADEGEDYCEPETSVLLPKELENFKGGSMILKIEDMDRFVDTFCSRDTYYRRAYDILAELDKRVLEDLETGEFQEWIDIDYKLDGMALFEFSHFEVDLREPDSQYRTLYVVYRYDTTAS